jgi:hypothetical protein
MKKVLCFILGLLLTATFSLADTYSENPDADTWIWPGYGPYGSSTELRTNRHPDYLQDIVMHFDLSSIPEFSIINSATLYAYRYAGNAAISGEIYRVTEDWDEATLVDYIAHDDANPYDTDVPLGDPNGWKEFDITALVQEWVDGTYDNYGVTYYGLTGTGYYQRHYSREYADPAFTPYLEVDYEEAAPPPGEFALLTPEDGAVIEVFTRGAGGDESAARVATPGGLAKTGTVTLFNPTQNPVDVDVEFTWDESENVETYDLTVDDNDDFSSPEVEVSDLTEETYTYTFTVTESITYYWTVTAYNDVGDTPCDEDFEFEFDYNNTNVEPASFGTVKAIFH